MVRDVIQLRTSLLPYLYTAFYDYYKKGIPPFRAMVLEIGIIEVTDQYMMGPSILVAPVFTGQKERKVILPAGNWYNFYNGKYVGNNETIVVETRLEQIPLFVKDGAIIPMMQPAENISRAETLALEVRYYGNKENSYLLYDDDGETFDYEKGDYALTELTVRPKPDGKLVGASKKLDKNVFHYGKITWRWMTE